MLSLIDCCWASLG